MRLNTLSQHRQAQRAIRRLIAKIDELEKDASYLWYNLDDGSFQDWEYWYDQGFEDANRAERKREREKHERLKGAPKCD
jgi:hypothetical protein